ncbi:MAG: hypothetical protein UIG59_04070 [Acutalibacteraceae bacterium]|nr:hypothetical protein [Acutalibacteraceae bacterium]
MKDKLTALLKNKNSAKILFIVGIAAILLIFASSYFPESSNAENSEKIFSNFSEEDYRAALETSVREMVAGISGDSGAIVTVTLETGLVYEYAQEIKSSDARDQNKESLENEQKIITVKGSDGREQPLIVTSYMPKIRGVSVICDLKSNETAEQIKNAVTAALNISSRKIYIGRKSGQ